MLAPSFLLVLSEVKAVDEYKTVMKEASDSFVEKKSRFIGWCMPVSTEEEALSFVKKIKSENREASHNVYAYALKNGIIRYSDDGEPQGTAGIPVLDVLQKTGLVDTVVVVTRYFGGILLGGGGLVRAYSHSASIAIAAAVPVTMRECLIMELSCDYSRYLKSEAAVAECGGVADDTVFGGDVVIKFHIAEKNLWQLREAVADITNGRGVLKETGKAFFGMENA